MIVFNFFFTEPLFTLHAYDAEYPVTFIVMLIVSFISCSIAARLKAIAIASDATYARTKLLFDTASRLHQTNGHDEILSTTGGQLIRDLIPVFASRPDRPFLRRHLQMITVFLQ